MNGICFSIVKRFADCRKALAHSEVLLREGVISDVGFVFGPADSETLPCSVMVDGQKIFLGNLYSNHLKTVTAIKGWIERSLVFDNFTGMQNPEICNIECMTGSFLMAIIHTDWRGDSDLKTPVSSLVIIDKQRHEYVVNCVCYHKRTLGRLYRSLHDSLNNHLSTLFHSEEIEAKTGRYI